jgi:hypothetical protein
MLEYRFKTMLANAVAYDRETDKVQPGLIAPPPVLGSASEWGPHEFDDRMRCRWCHKAAGELSTTHCIHGVLLDNEQALAVFKQILDNPQAIVCVANGPYDFLVDAEELARRGEDVMPKIFAMYDPEGTVVRGFCDGRVFEIFRAEGLHAIAQGHLGKHALSLQPFKNDNGRAGRYSLTHTTFEVTGREDAKVNDKFRLSYAQFRGVPLHMLPFEARTYPVDDTNNTLECALGQAGFLPSVNRHDWVGHNGKLVCRYCEQPMTPELPAACMRKQRRRNLHWLSMQAYFDWASHLGAAWGLYIPQGEVDKLEKKVDDAAEKANEPFLAAGFLRKDADGVYHEVDGTIKRAVAIAYGARDLCTTCNGTGKVPSEKTNGKTKVNCKACDGSGLYLPPDVPRAEKGGIGTSRDVKCESGDELLMDFGEQPSKKIKTTYIPLMRKGRACNVCGLTGVKTKYKPAHEEWCTAPNGEMGYRQVPYNVRTDPLKATLRAAIEEGLHSMPRHGGVRECFHARPGYVYSSEDYKAGELVTLAQACLEEVGYSKLADALNALLDPHLALAGQFCSKSYEVMLAAKKAKEAWLDPLRQVGKKSNFGFGGGMAEVEFVLKPCRADPDSFTPCPNGPTERNLGTWEKPNWVRGFNGTRPCIMMRGEDYCGRPGEKVLMYNDKPTGSPVCMRCLQAGKFAREMFFRQWPEVKELHAKVKKLTKTTGPSGTPEISYAGLITRGDLGFCDGANSYFQMRLAAAAKAAFCQVQRECVDRTWRVRSSEMMKSAFEGMQSPLLGSRAILLFHDEIVAEHPESVAPEAAERLSECMVESLRWKCPGMYKAVEAKPTIVRRLYKGAEPVYDKNGRLTIWEPS